MTSKPVFELKHTHYRLSIQLFLNGFSFCIANSSGKIIDTFQEKESDKLLSEVELKNKLQHIIDTRPELQANFEKIEVIYTHDLYTFIPKSLYDSNQKSIYFKYALKTLSTDVINEDTLADFPIVNLFIPYTNVNNLIFDRYKEFNFQHTSSVLANYLLQKEQLEQNPKVYLYFHANYFDLIAIKGSTLLMYNTFTGESAEDVLYYVLFCFEQLQFSPNEIAVEVLNDVAEDTFDALYQYIRNVSKSPQEKQELIHKLVLKI